MGAVDEAIGVGERIRSCTEGSALSQVVADALANRLAN